MQQAIDAPQIDEGAEVGDILDYAFAYLALFEDLDDLLAHPRALFFEYGSP